MDDHGTNKWFKSYILYNLRVVRCDLWFCNLIVVKFFYFNRD